MFECASGRERPMLEADFTALFPFCGLGAGARGFLDAEVEMLGRRGRFRSIGGIDFDAEACVDFEALTDSPALCADIGELTARELRAFAGDRAPDVVFSSPPCQGFSGLLSKKKSKGAKYQALNRLLVQWVEVMLEAWPEEPPALVLIENVPRITSRGAGLLRRVKGLLRKAGYVFHQDTHDCGELGGLAQHRRRFLLVARLPKRCPPLLYQPPKRRVRGCGEVLESLPLPGADAGGPMHVLPRIAWRTWQRLALIPAGGDWRDLPGVLEGKARREVHKRHEVADWAKAVGTIAGSGSNGVGAVADPRWHSGVMGVLRPDQPAPTVTGGASPTRGTFSIAHDLTVKRAFDHGYRVLGWDEPSFTVAGQTSPGCGAYQVADPRVPNGVRIDVDGYQGDPSKPPPFVPVIVSDDGTWHRPLTTLDLAALQGLPSMLKGRPLKLTGTSSTRWRKRIGNAVPVGTAEAIARRMLVALVEADAGAFSLSSLPVWVSPERLRA